MVSSNLELHRYATGRKTRVPTAMTLLKSHLFRCAGGGGGGGLDGGWVGDSLLWVGRVFQFLICIAHMRTSNVCRG
jgi:hypothetical protein